MALQNKFNQEKPWAVLDWPHKQWKRSKMWKKAGVRGENDSVYPCP